MHTFGCPANLEAILEIAGRHNLRVIEDACEAIGAEYNGRRVGTFGDAGIFSFYPNKQITTGEGGVVVTRNPEVSQFVRKVRNQGRDNPENWFQHSELGYNYRISEINCALGIEQLRRIEPILTRREAIARQYSRILAGRSEFKLPPMNVPCGRISWFVYVDSVGNAIHAVSIGTGSCGKCNCVGLASVDTSRRFIFSRSTKIGQRRGRFR